MSTPIEFQRKARWRLGCFGGLNENLVYQCRLPLASAFTELPFIQERALVRQLHGVHARYCRLHVKLNHGCSKTAFSLGDAVLVADTHINIHHFFVMGLHFNVEHVAHRPC